MKPVVRAAIALLLSLGLWLVPTAVTSAQPALPDAPSVADASSSGAVQETEPVAATPPVGDAAVDTVQAVSDAVEAPDADLTDIFSSIVRAMTTTDTALKSDADETSIIEVLADVNEAADQQALNAEPTTLDGTVENWLTSVKTFLDLK